MANLVQCPHCGAAHSSTPELAGQTVACTRCGQPFVMAAGPAPIGYQMYTPPTATQSNGYAVGSLVSGLIGLVIPVIPGLIGIVLGVIGLNKTKDPRVGGKGLAIAGVVVSAVSILMSGCVVSILLPSLNRAREQANRVKCASNMKQIGLAMQMYATTNRGQYPPDLSTLLAAGQITTREFDCPSSSTTPAAQAPGATALGSYVYVPGATQRSPSTQVVLYEPLTNHGNDGTNMLFADGHVEWVARARAQQLISTLNAAPPALAPPGALDAPADSP